MLAHITCFNRPFLHIFLRISWFKALSDRKHGTLGQFCPLTIPIKLFNKHEKVLNKVKRKRECRDLEITDVRRRQFYVQYVNYSLNNIKTSLLHFDSSLEGNQTMDAHNADSWPNLWPLGNPTDHLRATQQQFFWLDPRIACQMTPDRAENHPKFKNLGLKLSSVCTMFVSLKFVAKYWPVLHNLYY